MRALSRRLAGAATGLGLMLSLSASPAAAQTATSEGCTTGDLVACVRVTVSAAIPNSLSFAVTNLGVFTPLALASAPSIVWSFVFATGNAEYNPADIVERAATVSATGDAVVNDASSWTLTDYGNLWALSYPSYLDPSLRTLGVGATVPLVGDALDASGNPWRQTGTTGVNGAITFSVALPIAFSGSLDGFGIEGLEAQSFTTSNSSATTGLAGSCGFGTPCGSVPATVVPEPGTSVLMSTGALLLALMGYRRRSTTRTAEKP